MTDDTWPEYTLPVPCLVEKLTDEGEPTGKIGCIVGRQEDDYVESYWVRWAGSRKRDIVERRFVMLRDDLI